MRERKQQRKLHQFVNQPTQKYACMGAWKKKARKLNNRPNVVGLTTLVEVPNYLTKKLKKNIVFDIYANKFDSLLAVQIVTFLLLQPDQIHSLTSHPPHSISDDKINVFSQKMQPVGVGKMMTAA